MQKETSYYKHRYNLQPLLSKFLNSHISPLQDPMVRYATKINS